MSDFETLCNDFINEFGIGGGGPLETQEGEDEAVVGQSGQLGRAVYWLGKANDYINILHIDWDWLWNEWTGSLAASSRVPTLPSLSVDGYAFAHFDRTSFYVNKNLSGWKNLRYKDYDEFRSSYDVGTIGAGKPAIISIAPNLSLKVNRTADTTYIFDCAGWKKPIILATDDATPDVPTQFERIIIARAAIYYGDKEDAPEIIEGASAEYSDILTKLESQFTPDGRWETMTQDLALAIEVPGASPSFVTR